MFADECICGKALGESTEKLERGNAEPSYYDNSSYRGNQELKDDGDGGCNPVSDFASAKQ
jgi:hypothetical protein